MRRIALTPLLGLFLVAPVNAQEVGTVRGLGLGDALTATARGYEAGLYNPAGLSRGGFSFALAGVRLGVGMSPVSVFDFAGYGEYLEPDEKAEIMSEVRSANGLTLSGGASVQGLGLSIGPVALNVTSSVNVDGTLPPALVELALYGNVGESGDATSFVFDGSAGRAVARGMAALSYGRSIALPLPGQFSIGVTGRYGYAAMADARSDTATWVRFDDNELEYRAEGTAILATNGRAYGADLGFGWEYAGWKAGLVFRDIMAGHSFDVDDVEFHETVRTGSIDSTYVDETNSLDYSELNADQKAKVDRRLDAPLTGTRVVAGLARDFGMLIAYSQVAFGSTKVDPDAAQVTLGASIKPLPFIEFRGAGSLGSEDRTLGGGLSVGVGPVALDFAAQRAYGYTDGWTAGVQFRIAR